MPVRQSVAAVVTAAAVLASGAGIAVAAPKPSPVTTGAPAAKSATRSVRYTVRRGDSFSAIARTYGIDPAALAKANGLRLTSVLLPGKVLVVPITLPAGLPSQLPAALLAVPDRLSVFPVLVAAAKEFNVPADLLMATAYVESGWKQSAVSATGALGVGQLKPDTARWIAVVLMRQPQLDPAVTKDNIRMSARFLRFLLDTTPDTRTALAAYFQGPGSASRDGITATGLAYATKILAVRPAFS